MSIETNLYVTILGMALGATLAGVIDIIISFLKKKKSSKKEIKNIEKHIVFRSKDGREYDFKFSISDQKSIAEAITKFEEVRGEQRTESR